MIDVLGQPQFDNLTKAACGSPRSRMHRNLHARWEEPSQRFINAIEPSSYIRPHRHVCDPKTECLVAVRGRFGVLAFGQDGRVEEALIICSAAGGASIVQIEPQHWHTVVSLESGGILFEVKGGPFEPSKAKEFAPWAPAEGDPSATVYLDKLRLHVADLK